MLPEAVSGMLLFDKPEGWTSHDAVAAFRRMRFRPAEIQGVPVAAWLDTVVEFEAN